MSVLANYLEEEGLATTIVSLVRIHSERVQPPRSLWVPFELGRPLGPPDDRAMRRRVIREALALLESDEGPFVLVDFESESDGTEPDAAWSPPIPAAERIDLSDGLDIVRQALRAEIAALKPAHEQVRTQQGGRTTVGLMPLELAEIGDHIVSFLDSPDQESPVVGRSAAMVMRFGVDDLKAYYTESASLGGRPSAAQARRWMWNDTVFGQVLVALRAAAMQSDDRRFNIVGSSFLVPRTQVAEAGL